MQLQMTRTQDGDQIRVLLDGRLDVQGSMAIHDQFVFQVTTNDGSAIVDCSKLTFIASIGMGMLVTVAKSLQRKGHELILLRPLAMVQQTLKMAGIDRVIRIVHDESELPGRRG